MGTRNNPSPGGLRPGLEATNRRTRREPVRSSNLARVTNASDSGDQVATGTHQTQTQSIPSSSAFDSRASAPQSDAEEALAMSIEMTEARRIRKPTTTRIDMTEARRIKNPTTTRRHNTRSTSRSVSPSLLHPEFAERTESSKGKGRARSTSASSTQVVEANGARRPKRGRAVSENRDDVDETKRGKRVKASHKNPPDRPQTISRKRNLRNQTPGSPILEDSEEEEFVDERVKRRRPVSQAELQFSYAPILAKYPFPSPQQPSQSSEEPAQQPEPTPSRTPQSTSNELALIPAPAEAEYSQRSDAESNPIEIAEQRAICDTPTSSTPQQHVIGRIHAQINDKRSGVRDVVQQRSTPRNRSESSSPILPTLKHPNPSTRTTATLNGSPVLRQGIMDIRVAQGSARKGGAELSSDSATKKAYLLNNHDKPRSFVRHPFTKAILPVNPMPIFEDSDYEDDSENGIVPKKLTPEEQKAWKEDLLVAKSTWVKVMQGRRLPEPGSSMKGMDSRITRRKLGDTSPASRQRENKLFSLQSNFVVIQGRIRNEPFVLTKVRNIDELIKAAEWSQESGNSVAEAIEFFEASKSGKTNRLRSAAPSPASQRGNSQPPTLPPSMSSFHQNPTTPRKVPDLTRSASLQLSNGEVAVRRSEMNEAAEDDESTRSFDDYEDKNDSASDKTSKVDADEATPMLPTTPTATPFQQASEPGAWSSVLTTVKKAVYSPFKFFGRVPNAAEAATTDLDKPEFTFSHPYTPAQPLTTPTRSNRQHAMPQSERRGNTNNERRVSFQARVPQTERQRRHVDRSTPLHLRGVPSTRDMQDLHAQQASTRQRKRDEDIASLEENELSHGKTFRAPSPSSESDDEDDDANTMTDNDDDEPASPPRKEEYAFLPQTVQPARRVHFEVEPTSDTRHEIQNSLTAAEEEAAYYASRPGPSNFRAPLPKTADKLAAEAWEASITNPAIKQQHSRHRVPSENGDSPYYYVLAKDWYAPRYRKVHKSDPDIKFWNIFGTEALWYKLRRGPFVELNHDEEPGLRGTPRTLTEWNNWMSKPENLKKEKKALLDRWRKVHDDHKPILLSEMRPYYKRLMEIGEFAPGGSSSTGAATRGTPSAATSSGTSSNTFSGTQSTATSSGTATASGASSNPFSGTATASVVSSNPFSGTPSAVTSSGTATASRVSSNIFSGTSSAATSGGTNGTANPNGTYKFPEDDESDGEGDDVEPDVADQAQFQTPPPKPRPGNAQLPQSQQQPPPARAALAAALASANKHRPSAPSNLRNVTQMSPLQQPDQENRENTNENGVNSLTWSDPKWKMTPAKEMISNAAIQSEDELRKQAAAEEAVMTPEEKRKQLDEVHRDLSAIPWDSFPDFILPKTQKMQWPEEDDFDYNEINAATKVAFESNHGGY